MTPLDSQLLAAAPEISGTGSCEPRRQRVWWDEKFLWWCNNEVMEIPVTAALLLHTSLPTSHPPHQHLLQAALPQACDPLAATSRGQ